MKYTSTFSEMGEIFACIAKAEKKVEKYICAEADYTEASNEYAESDFNYLKGIEMHKRFEASEKARKAVKAAFKQLLKLFQADSNNYGDEELRKLAARDYEPYRFLYAAKYEAMRLAKCIEI